MVHTHDGIPADVGACGLLTSRAHHIVRTYVPIALYAVSLVIYIMLTGGVQGLRQVHNELVAIMVGCGVFATTLRRTAPLLWSEPGKLTYLRVHAVNTQLVPDTPRGQVCLYALVVDFFFLPFCIAFAAYHHLMPFSIVGVIFFPPTVPSVVPLLVLFGVFACLGVVSSVSFHCVVLALDRVDPFLFDRSMIPKVAAITAALLAIPAVSLSCAALPCSGELMRFGGNVQCQSRTHRIAVGIAAPVLALLGGLMEAGTASFRLLRDASGGDVYSAEPRCDLLLFELLLALRWAVVLTAATALTWSGYMVAVLFSSLLLLWSTQYALPASVAVLRDVYRGVVAQSLFATLLTMTLMVLLPDMQWGSLCVWMLLWALLTVSLVTYYIKTRGIALVERVSDAAVMIMMDEFDEQ